MASSAGGSDAIGNAPQPQNPSFEADSSLGATNHGADKSKIQNNAIPVDSARTGIPIVMLGKSLEIGEKVSAFLQPSYLVIHQSTDIPSLISKLPTFTDIRPVAVYFGGGFSEEEQSEAESKINELDLGQYAPIIVKSRPVDQELQHKYRDLPLEEAAPRIVKETLDKVELRELPLVPEKVSENAV